MEGGTAKGKRAQSAVRSERRDQSDRAVTDEGGEQ